MSSGIKRIGFIFWLGVVLNLHVNAWAAPTRGSAAHCEAIRRSDFAQVQDAPTEITDTKWVEPGANSPGYCQVSGYVASSVGFVVRLPENWNEKFLELGCGGFCGSTDHISECDDPLSRGYVCIVSDNGHKSLSSQSLWAYNNLQAQIDHAYRGAHVTALAGKALVERYFGQAPGHSYFMGGSTGGRQAMIEAQRFPWDFDGIVAAAPSLSVTGIHMNLLWGNRAFNDSNGNPLFSQANLDALHQAVVSKCDMNDAIKDGLIGDPRACQFDPEVMRCPAKRGGPCLNSQQIEAVKKIYGGAVTLRGEPIYMPAALKGSEDTWLDWFSRMFSANPHATYDFVREEFRYSAFQPNAGPTWKPEDFDFDRDYKRLGMAESLSGAVNPDLRQFKSAGGKLIAWAGWSDAAGMPLHTVDYYETAERVAGGRSPTQQFLRLFMLPGVGHGWGEGAYLVDWLSYLEIWVEKGHGPDEIIGYHVKLDDVVAKALQGNLQAALEMRRRMTFPLDPATVEFSRPAFPYPTATKYSGHGDPRSANSFVAASR